MDEQTAYLILLRAPALFGAQLFMLLAEHGSACDAMRAGPAGWQRIGLTAACRTFLESTDANAVNAERRWLDADHHYLITLNDPAYPALLKELADPRWDCS